MQKYAKTILVVVGILTAIGLQVWSTQWRLLGEQRVATGSLGLETFFDVGVEILLGVASGVVLALILIPAQVGNAVSFSRTGAIGVLLISLAAIGIYLGAALSAFQLPGSLSLQIMFWDWIHSGLPSVLLGLSIVALIYSRRT
jgi:hypothetical protein